jgi:hypothetical protein
LHGVAAARPSHARWTSAWRLIPDYGHGAIRLETEFREIRAVQLLKVQRAGAGGFGDVHTPQKCVFRRDSTRNPFFSSPPIQDSHRFLKLRFAKA